MDDHSDEEELIFNSISTSPFSLDYQKIGQQEPVDLEIILLNRGGRRSDRSRKQKNNQKQESSKSTSKSELNEFDPYFRQKNKAIDHGEAESSEKESFLASSDLNSDRLNENFNKEEDKSQPNMKDSKLKPYNNSNRKKSPTVNDDLLNRLERRYREGGNLETDDDLNIDYMDYF